MVNRAEIMDSYQPAGVLAFILAENCNDAMSLGMSVSYVSRRPFREDRLLRPTTLRYLENALAAGLLSVGDMIGTQHRPWNMSYTAALRHLAAARPRDAGDRSPVARCVLASQHGQGKPSRGITCTPIRPGPRRTLLNAPSGPP